MPLINLSHAEVLVDGLDHPEGVTVGPDGQIYAGGEAGQIYRIDLTGRTVQQIASTGGFNLGLALDADSNLYVCNNGSHVVNRVTQAGAASVYSAGNSERAMITPNYPAFAADGTLFVADSGDWKADNGCIWAIAPGGAATVLDESCCQFPNGCAVSPDGGHLYVAMSLNAPRVVRISIANGRKTGPVEVVVELPHTVPDGLAFCSDGSLLISCYRPDTIFRLAPGGVLGVLMDDYEGTLLGAPTNLCFAGPDRRVLVWANLGRWHLGMNARTGLQGAPLFYPQLVA
jgi:gluconolactonase